MMNEVQTKTTQHLRRGLNLFEVLYLVLVIAVAIAVSKWLANTWQVSQWATLPLVLTSIAMAVYVLNRIGDIAERNSPPRMLVAGVCDDGSPIRRNGVNLIAEFANEIDKLANDADTYESLVEAYDLLEMRYRRRFIEKRCARYLDRILAAKRCEAALRWRRPVGEVEALYNTACNVGFPGGEPHKRDIDEARSQYLRSKGHFGLSRQLHEELEQADARSLFKD